MECCIVLFNHCVQETYVVFVLGERSEGEGGRNQGAVQFVLYLWKHSEGDLVLFVVWLVFLE